MVDYSLLKTKLSDTTLAGLTDEQIRVALNTKDIPVKVPISVSKIKAYLQMVGKRLAVIDSVSIAARNAEVSFKDFETFDMTDPNYVARLDTILNDLVIEGLITATDKTAILTLGDSAVSWADQNWQGDVTLTDITNARAYV